MEIRYQHNALEEEGKAAAIFSLTEQAARVDK